MFRISGLKVLSSGRRVAVTTSFFGNLGFHRDALLSFKFFSVLPSNASFGSLKDECIHSFTVSYLVNSCGMPLQTALDVASKVKFKTPKNPDIVLSLLRTQGFTKSQISKIVKQFPRLLFFNSDRTLLPKFEFLHSIGLSKSDCVQIVYSCPFLLGSSVKNHLLPCYNYLKSVLVVDEKVIKCLKRSPRAFRQVFPDKIAPNIELLRTSGVSDVLISSLVSNVPDSAFRRHSKFRSIVNQVRDMGFDPSKVVFVEAIRVLSGMSSLTWERKFKAYSKYGWSKDQTLLAFKKFPPCLSVSEEKIFKNMDFFVHKMGLMAVDIATKPTVMVFSLEKRIIPRCSVVQSLYSKGLLKKKLSIASILHPTEKTFLEKYVTKFPNDATWLLHLYTGEVKIFDV